MVIPWWEWIGKAADVLSLLTLLAAVAAWWQIRKLNSRYQGLLRIPEQLTDLEAAASEIISAAPYVSSNPDAVLNPLSTAEGKLTSLAGWVGGRYVFFSRRRELVLEIIEVRDELKRRQARGARLDEAVARDAYRKISKVAQRINDHIEDRRLEQ
jgi:hypothetical protein